MAYLIASAIVMTLSVAEGYYPIAILFKCDFWYLWYVARSLCTYTSGDAENAGPENAGLDFGGPNSRAGKCRTGI